MIVEVIIDIIESLGYLLTFPFKVLTQITQAVFKPQSKKRTAKNHKRLNKIIKVKSLNKLINKKFKHRNILVFVLGFFLCILLIVIPMVVIRWFAELPSPDLLIVDGYRRSTKILDRNDQLLYEIYVDKDLDPVRLNQIPDMMVKATVAAEDANFYTHRGLDFKSIFRALGETIFKGNLQGGSTITQQLIKNVLLTPERTISRKLKEWVLAVLVEAKYSKEQIIEMYLNNTPYGGTAWGVQSAAKKYFNKNIWELDLAQASLLAGLPSAPTLYSPLTNLEAAKARQKYVLDKMVSLGFIFRDEADRAYSEQILFTPPNEFIRAPHFVNFIREELIKTYGLRMVELGGLTVKTTLDLDLTNKVQQIVAEEVANRGVALDFSNGAAVVIDPRSSEILAYVGSVDYFKDGWGSFDVVTALRQPGSSIKPVTYALALSKNYTLVSTIEDAPVSYTSVLGEKYVPVNYDGKYHGPVTVKQALANSYNIPAVKLAEVVKPDNIVKLGIDMGLSNWQVGSDYGLSITLGGKEVRLLDLANVYADFAREGVYKKPTPFISISDSNGHSLWKNEENTRQVISKEVSFLIWNILSDYRARIPAFGTDNYLSITGHTVAVKTGTTDSKKDNWTLGYTPSYVVGVWVGNNDGHPMNPFLSSGLTGAAPIWNAIFKYLLEGKPDENYQVPTGVFLKESKECNRTEYFIKSNKVPSTLCVEASSTLKSGKNKNH